MIAPGGTPQPILVKLNDRSILSSAWNDVRSRLKDLGMNPVGKGSPAELQLFLELEITRWGKVVDAAGIAGIRVTACRGDPPTTKPTASFRLAMKFFSTMSPISCATPRPPAAALVRCGFAPTPISIQVSPDPAGGTRPTGTGNITVMFDRGYAEILFKTSDTPLSHEFDAALERHAGMHLAAFAVADAETAHRRLAANNFAVRDLVRMSRPVATETGQTTAAFTIARVEPGVMPEGRIQTLTHHTEHAVWQPRWLSHPNGATGLIDVVIAVADVEEAAQRFSRFTGRAATRTSSGAGR